MDSKICLEPSDAARCQPEVLPCLQGRCPECRQGGEAAGRDGAEGQGGSTTDLPELEELELEDDPAPERREELLRTVRTHRVRKMTEVWCNEDPAWPLQMLLLAAPHVEELEVHHVRREHLEAVLAMPRLKRLDVDSLSTDQSLFPVELLPLPAHHAGLRWLCVDGLPRETTFSLIRRHAATLEDLWLWVGTPGGGEWPDGCDDLHAALGRCGLAGLRRLMLWRHHDHRRYLVGIRRGKPLRSAIMRRFWRLCAAIGCRNSIGYPWTRNHRDFESCRAQLSAVRGALPGVKVQCYECGKAPSTF